MANECRVFFVIQNGSSSIRFERVCVLPRRGDTIVITCSGLSLKVEAVIFDTTIKPVTYTAVMQVPLRVLARLSEELTVEAGYSYQAE